MSEHLRANGHSSAATLIASDSNSQPELPIGYLSGYGVKLQFATNGYAGDMLEIWALFFWVGIKQTSAIFCTSLLVPCMEYMQLFLPSVRISHDKFMDTVAKTRALCYALRCSPMRGALKALPIGSPRLPCARCSVPVGIPNLTVAPCSARCLA